MPKKRGGQPDNKNAYKHGYYSKYFTAHEGRALSEIPVTDMSGEIGLLRVNIDRFMQLYTTSLGKLDYEDRLAGLRAITLAVGRIASLERIRSAAAKNSGQVDELIKMLDSIPEELLDQEDEYEGIRVEEPDKEQDKE